MEISVTSSPDIDVTVTPAGVIQVELSIGTPGADGEGVVAGGTTGQVLAKASNDDYDTEWISISGSGTVTSVALTVPSAFSVSGSPITTSGTLAVSLATQAANRVWAGPTTGADATPTFRALVAADIPDLSATYAVVGHNHTGVYSPVGHIHAISDTTGLQAALDGKADLVGGVLATAQIPAIAITEYLGEVANQSAMLALVGQKGDWAIRTDSGKVWVITGSDPTLLADWTELEYPASPVTSVNSQTGTVVLSAADVGAQPADATLTALAGLSTADNTIIIGTGTDTFATVTLDVDEFPIRTGLSDITKATMTSVGRTLVAGLSAGAMRTTLGATTVGGNIFTLTNPGAVTWPRMNADNTVTARTASETRTDLSLASARTRTITVTIDGGGSELTTGLKLLLPKIPFAGTIVGYSLAADQTGSIVLDIWKSNGAVPTNSNTITASAKPTLSSAQIGDSTTLTGWTTSISVGDVFGFEIESITTITRIVLVLEVTTS